MAERWVLNASPLIVLARVGLEGLPLSLAEQVVVPRPVVEEIQAGPSLDPARRAFAADRFTIVDPPPPPAELLAWDLGYGETAVLSWTIAEQGGRRSWMMEKRANAPALSRFHSRERWPLF